MARAVEAGATVGAVRREPVRNPCRTRARVGRPGSGRFVGIGGRLRDARRTRLRRPWRLRWLRRLGPCASSTWLSCHLRRKRHCSRPSGWRIGERPGRVEPNPGGLRGNPRTTGSEVRDDYRVVREARPDGQLRPDLRDPGRLATDARPDGQLRPGLRDPGRLAAGARPDGQLRPGLRDPGRLATGPRATDHWFRLESDSSSACDHHSFRPANRDRAAAADGRPWTGGRPRPDGPLRTSGALAGGGLAGAGHTPPHAGDR